MVNARNFWSDFKSHFPQRPKGIDFHVEQATPIVLPADGVFIDANVNPNTQIQAVKDRLALWTAYYNDGTHQPLPAYSVEDRVADTIYEVRRPKHIHTHPAPKLDLNVSDEDIIKTFADVLRVYEGTI